MLKFKRTVNEVLAKEIKKRQDAFKTVYKTDEGRLVLDEIMKFCKPDSIVISEFGILAERNGMRKVAKFIKDYLESKDQENQIK